jgi:hypothetical protein
MPRFCNHSARCRGTWTNYEGLIPVPPHLWHLTILSPFVRVPLPSQFLHGLFLSPVPFRMSPPILSPAIARHRPKRPHCNLHPHRHHRSSRSPFNRPDRQRLNNRHFDKSVMHRSQPEISGACGNLAMEGRAVKVTLPVMAFFLAFSERPYVQACPAYR